MQQTQSPTRVGARYRALGSMALCAALGLLAPGAAQAEPKYNRRTHEITVKQTEATKKIEAKVKPEDAKKAAPQITADQFFFIETAVQNIRDDQIQVLKDLISDTEPDDPERADLLFRLAELYAQKVRHNHSLAMDAAIKADTAKKPADKKKYTEQSKKYLAAEKKELQNAVQVYKAIAENPKFKNYARMDEALFYYAFTLSQAKYDEPARKIFFRLIKDYPNSRYIPDAYLSFAEWYFKNNDLDNANKFYDKVLQFPKSGVYLYAKYMKGWVYYNQANPKESLTTWLEVAQATQGDKKQATLNRAAKKDFVRAYADVGSAEKAYQAFQRVDQAYSFTMLSMLGELYLAQGKADKTIFVFRQMIALDKEDGKFDKNACDWEYTIVRATMTVGGYTDKVQEIGRLLKWWKYLKDNNAIPEPNLAECRDNAEATTGELAKLWHQEGLKTLNYETLGYAQELYKVFLEYFPESQAAPEMQFYYADLIWKRAENEKNPSLSAVRWEEAAQAHQKVVEMNKVKPDLIKESAYAAVIAWKNALAVDVTTEKPPAPAKEGVVPKPEPIPEKEQKMLAAFDIYLKHVKDPKDEELIQIKFFKGRTLWRHYHYEEAIPYFEDIIKSRPEHETAEYSANLLRNSLARLNRTEEYVKWVDRMLAMPKLLADRDDLKSDLEKDKRLSEGKLAESYDRDGRYKECGEQYLMIFNKYLASGGKEGGEDLVKILFNAGVCFEKAKLLGQAIQMREELIKRFPDKVEAQKAQYALGFNYAQIAGPYYVKAAEKFEAYARKFGGEKNAIDALKNAFFFRKGIGHDKEATEDIEYFVKQYGAKQPKEAAAAAFSLADIYEKQQKTDVVVKKLNEYLKRWGGKGGVDRQIAAHVRIGEILWQASCSGKGVNGACVEVKRSRALKTKRSKRSSVATQCGPEWKMKVTVLNRKPALVKEAKGHFQAALKLWKGGEAVKDVPGEDEGDKAARAAGLIYYAAAANFYLAEEKYEEFLRISFPTGLDFDQSRPKKAKDSKKRFDKWLEDKQKTLASAKDIYMAVVDIKGGGATWAVASAARVGQLFQNFADALFTAEIPPLTDELKKLAREAGMPIDEMQQTFADTYCDALMTTADPLEQKSIEAYSFCLDTSLKLNWSNDWSRLCEGELSQIRPQDYPSAGEIHAVANGMPLTLDVQSIVKEIEAPKAAQ